MVLWKSSWFVLSVPAVFLLINFQKYSSIPSHGWASWWQDVIWHLCLYGATWWIPMAAWFTYPGFLLVREVNRYFIIPTLSWSDDYYDVQAVSNGFWVVFEDVDKAPPDVQCILLPLLEGTPSFFTGHGEVFCNVTFACFWRFSVIMLILCCSWLHAALSEFAN